MAGSAAVIFEDYLRIPLEVGSLDAFRRWCHSPDFPERGRVDFLAGNVEVDMSPEDLYTHGVLKTALAVELHALVTRTGLGNVFVDRTRVSSPAAALSVEPDLVVVLWSSLDAGRIREVPAASGQPQRFIELEGAPDLVVEIVSDSSERKDRERLPRLYERAGVPELWVADVRGERPLLEVHSLETSRYRVSAADADGWTPSPVLARNIRVRRSVGPRGRWSYEVEHIETRR